MVTKNKNGGGVVNTSAATGQSRSLSREPPCPTSTPPAPPPSPAPRAPILITTPKTQNQKPPAKQPKPETTRKVFNEMPKRERDERDLPALAPAQPLLACAALDLLARVGVPLEAPPDLEARDVAPARRPQDALRVLETR